MFPEEWRKRPPAGHSRWRNSGGEGSEARGDCLDAAGCSYVSLLQGCAQLLASPQQGDRDSAWPVGKKGRPDPRKSVLPKASHRKLPQGLML